MNHSNNVALCWATILLMTLNVLSSGYVYDNESLGFETNVTAVRKGRFLFDTIFGLESAATENDEDDDDNVVNDVKNCNCGKVREQMKKW